MTKDISGRKGRAKDMKGGESDFLEHGGRKEKGPRTWGEEGDRTRDLRRGGRQEYGHAGG